MQLTMETVSRAMHLANSNNIVLRYKSNTITDRMVDMDGIVCGVYSRVTSYDWYAKVYGLELSQNIPAGHDHADEILNAWLDYVETCVKLMGPVA